MKRKLLVAALVLVTALMLGGVALAATNPIVCEMEVSPSALSEPGEVTVTITISNSGDTDMKDPLTLYSPTSEIVTDFGDKGSVTLKAGEVKTWTGKWTVNQRTLDNGQIVFFVKYFLYKDNGEKEAQSQPIRGKLSATEAKTDIEIKRTISPGTARQGQTVTVMYDIVNTGTVTLKNVTLTESKDISKKAVTVAKELKAGEGAQVKFPITMGKKDLTSSATITYTTGDSTEKKTKKVDAQKITYGEAALTAKLTSSAKGVAINGTVKLTLELKNGGNVNYTDVRVSDATLGDVFTNQELAAGGTLKLEKEITLTQTTNYQFKVVAIDNTGTEVTLDSDAITVTAVDPSKMVHLNISVAADRTEVYTQPGIVRFSITVENDSEVDAKDVTIYHGDIRIYTFPSIPAGQTRKLTRDAALSMAGKYQFTAATVDAMETTSTFISNEIQIAFSVPTPAPATPTPPLVPTPEPTYAAVTAPPISHPSVGTVPKLIRSVFYPLMIVGIILLIGAAVLLALATKKRIEQKRASDAALDHLDRAKRRDYVAPSEEPEERPATQEAPKPAAATPTPGKTPATAAEATDDIELPHMKYVRNAYERTNKAQTDNFGKKSVFDEDPLVGGAQDEDLYHTYGSDSDLPSAAAGAKPSARSNAKVKDWSAYAKRPAGQAEDTQGFDPHASYRRDTRIPDANAAYDEATSTNGDAFAAYDDPTAYAAEGAYPAQDGYADDAAYADGAEYADGATTYPDEAGYDADGGYAAANAAYDTAADDGTGYDAYAGYPNAETAYPDGQDGYVTDPLGYGDQSGYTDGQAAYDDPACYPAAHDPQAGDYGAEGDSYAQPDYAQPSYADAPVTPRLRRRSEQNRPDRS